MELEFNDVLKGNSFGVKFVAMQTPTSLPAKMNSLPAKVFFTFKFYTFNMVQTDAVQLRLSKQIEEKLSSQKSVSFDPKIELARKYYLVQEEQFGLFTAGKPAIEQILDHALCCPFEVNATKSGERTEHEKFARYLKDSVLSVDVWNGED